MTEQAVLDQTVPDEAVPDQTVLEQARSEEKAQLTGAAPEPTEPSEPSRPSEDEALVADELLVEEVSIDGMCGVY